MRHIFAVGLAGFLAACSSQPAVQGEWYLEGSTQRSACLLSVFEDGKWAHNCNGYNVVRGSWKVEAGMLRLIFEAGGSQNCTLSFQGSFLVLGDDCRYRGRYQPAKEWYAEN